MLLGNKMLENQQNSWTEKENVKNYNKLVDESQQQYTRVTNTS